MISNIYFHIHTFLRRHKQYNKIFLASDRTKLERVKHKGIVDELKRRKANGETNLTIRNGMILQRQPRRSSNVQATNTNNNSAST